MTDDARQSRRLSRPKGINVGRAWGRQAQENEEEWGVQHPEELLSAINEEVGEIEQAYLEATHEDGDPGDVEEEIDDLGPLLMQLVESLRTHPMAFDPLPTRAEAEPDRIQFTCSDCGEEVVREPHKMDVPGLKPGRCASCTFDKMGEP